MYISVWLRKKTEFLKRSASKRPRGSPLGMCQSQWHPTRGGWYPHTACLSNRAMCKWSISRREVYNIQITFGLREIKRYPNAINK